jgi:hypothetical protein
MILLLHVAPLAQLQQEFYHQYDEKYPIPYQVNDFLTKEKITRFELSILLDLSGRTSSMKFETDFHFSGIFPGLPTGK